jgi:hypothetical protein
MRSLKVLGILMFVLALGSMATAGENKMGVKEVSRVTFVAPVRIGTTLLTPGEYVIHHRMDGEDHYMVFQKRYSKNEIKVKCTLVPLAKKADRDEEVYQLSAGNERILQELIFRGDLAKHVF